MTQPRATSDDADELAATISSLKSRLNELESTAGLSIPPVGSIIDYIGSTAPSGWTILDGGTITNGRTLYPVLWSVLPSSFKSGNNIIKPDTRGKVTVAQGGTEFVGAVGLTGGSETTTLTVNQMPSHRHGTWFGRTTDGAANGYGLTITGGFADRVMVYFPNTINGNYIELEGGSQPHTNIQPYIIVVKIMKLL